MRAAVLGAIRKTLRRFRKCGAVPGRDVAPWIVALTHSPHTKLALRVSVFREEWHYNIATSLEDALRLLDRNPVDALLYDLDFGEGDWRALCRLAIQRGIGFQLIATAPDDDLFLDILAAGGAGVLFKPVTPDQLISSIAFARTLAEATLTHAAP